MLIFYCYFFILGNNLIMNLEKLKNLQFISPRLTIKFNHLTKDDTKHIKNTLNNKLGSASFFISVGLALISVFVFLFLQINTGWKQIEIYGIGSTIADIGAFIMSIIAIALKLISMRCKDDKTIVLLNRFSIDSLYIAITILMFGSFYADAEQGFLSLSPTISVGIIVLAFLLIVQPIFVVDAAVLNLSAVITMAIIAIYCKIQFDIQGLIYYILIIVGFLSMSRVFTSILFYAEAQKYIQESISNSLLDTAMYDELTHCKNRYALKQYLEEKVPVWKSERTKLLVVMFDIDNFKEYNDYFSHQVGDGCLKAITNSIKKSFNNPRLELYRYGGEEFLLFFELEEEESAEEILEKIRLAAAELDIKAPPTSPLDYLTISVGGYLLYTNDNFDFKTVLSEADTNLYKAKENGKNACYLNGQRITK